MLRKITKLISLMLVVIILCANTGTIASYAAQTYKSLTELENQGTSTNNTNVEFDAYFAGGGHSNTIDITNTEAKLYLSVKVKNAGYLENAEIDLSECNFNIADDGSNAGKIQSIDTENKKVILNTIGAGNNIEVALNITPKRDDIINPDIFKKDTTIRMKGTYINSNAKSVNVSKDITIHTSWDGTAKVNLSQEVVTYIPYEIDGNKGLLVQTKINVGIENDLLPIKTTNLEVEVPTIVNTKPEKVIVYANRTTATNGKTTSGELNYKYDADSGKVTITTANPEIADGNVTWSKNNTDEYLVTYIYSSAVYEAVKDQTTVMTTKATAKCDLYNDVTSSVTKWVEETNTYGNKIGQIVTLKTNIKEDSVAKGYMYSNKIATEEDRNETTYNVEYTLEVAYANLVDKLTIETASDEFIKNTETIESYAYNKTIAVNKIEFEKILGLEGYINILLNGNIIKTINKDNYEQNIDISSYNLNSLTIETSKPIAEGRLTINVQKAIRTNLEYSKAQIEEFTNLKTDATLKTTTAQNVIETLLATDTMALTEPTSKASISINQTNLSIVRTNENIEIRAILETDSMDDMLYKNPTIIINLPEAVSGIKIKSVKPLYDDEVSVNTSEITDINGHKAIKLVLTGTQTKYSDSTSKGVNVVIYADIELNKTASAGAGKIAMDYTNENDTISSNRVEVGVNIVAPKELVTVSTINVDADVTPNVTAVNDETKIVNIPVYANATTAIVTGEIINNYDNTISEVNILGRIPNKNSTNYDSNENMGNTFNTTLNDGIALPGLNSGYTIYYSSNPSATKDLTNTNNSWTTSVTDYSEVKSYLIVIDQELATRADISWTYILNIPGDLNYKNSINSNYKVYMKNNLESGTIQESKASPTISLQTEVGPGLDATISAIDVENGGIITKGKEVTFDVKIKNTGSKTLNNVKVEIPIPSGMEYKNNLEAIKVNETTGNIEMNIEEFEPGTIIDTSIELTCKEVGTSNMEVTITADEIGGYIKSNKYTINIEDADIAIVNSRYFNVGPVSKGETLNCELKITNLSSEELKNVEVDYQLSNSLSYIKYSTIEELNEEVSYDDDRDLVTFKIPTLMPNITYIFDIDLLVEDVTDNMQTIAKTTINGKEYTSNTLQIEGIKTEYTLNAINPGEKNIKNGEQFTSKFELENTGDTTIFGTNLTYNIPEGATFISGTIESKDNVIELDKDSIEENKLEYTAIKLEPNSKLILTVNLIVELSENEEEKEISSFLEASHETLGDNQSSVLTYIVENEKTEDNENTISNDIINNEIVNNEVTNNEMVNDEIITNNPTINPGQDGQPKNKINGKVWIDGNKNGKYENQEEMVEKLIVLLVNKEDGNIVMTTITNSKGEYTLDNVKNGEYMVAFLYDTSIYTITEYQKDGVEAFANSDAINSVIEYNGFNTRVGITDTLKISDSDLDNIDLGIYRVEEFDLSLQKYVSKVTVNNDSGVKTYDYNNQNKTLVKVEIPDKYMSSSTVIIEYKIIVKNEGDIPGYAKKIVDYIPSDMKFSSELNPNAYEGKDGRIYSEELANTIINPGESKEITLILIKNMTEENTGTVVNKAEISESYNDLGLEDVNSVAGNEDEKENDLGFANVIITVKTGQIIGYTTLTITIVAILAVGIYLIKKYVVK